MKQFFILQIQLPHNCKYQDQRENGFWSGARFGQVNDISNKGELTLPLIGVFLPFYLMGGGGLILPTLFLFVKKIEKVNFVDFFFIVIFSHIF